MNSTLTIICGHYGCGKTNLSLNLALENTGRDTCVVDFDIVNPYFRSSDYVDFLATKGIEMIAPNYAGTTLDTPSIPAGVYSIFAKENTDVFIDVGGDDAGATALGRIQDRIHENPYEMIYVINKNRILSQKPLEALELLKEIEKASRLNATAIINNTHLGVESTFEDCINSLEFAKEVSEITGLPLLYSTIPEFAVKGNEVPCGFKVIERLVKFPWE